MSRGTKSRLLFQTNLRETATAHVFFPDPQNEEDFKREARELPQPFHYHLPLSRSSMAYTIFEWIGQEYPAGAIMRFHCPRMRFPRR